jgi:type I restriction enzyme R subunit
LIEFSISRLFILDEVFVKLPSPPFTPEEKKLVAEGVYAHVWQQAMSGGLDISP